MYYIIFDFFFININTDDASSDVFLNGLWNKPTGSVSVLLVMAIY